METSAPLISAIVNNDLLHSNSRIRQMPPQIIHIHYTITAESKGEKILKIGQHLPKLWAIKLGVVFYETRCTVDHRPRSSCSLPSDAHDVLRLLDAWRNRGTDLQPWHQFIRRKVRLFGIGITSSSTWLCSLQRLRSGRRIQVCRRVERVGVHTGHFTDLVTWATRGKT